MKQTLCLAISLAIVLSIIPASTEAQENLSIELQVGFDSFYKIGAWTPVQVAISNQGPDVQAELHLRDDLAGFGASNVRYIYPLDLPGQSRKQFTVYLPLRGQRRLRAELVDGEGTRLLTEQTNIASVSETGLLIGVVASDPSLLNAVAALTTMEGEQVAVAHLGVDDLPSAPQAWTGLDILVLNDIDSAQLNTDQRAALESWLQFGGRLVIGGGPNAAQTMAGLGTLLPSFGVTIETLPHPVAALENSIGVPLEDRGPYVAAVPTNFTGEIRMQEANLPLIITAERGLGRLIYVVFDLSLAPLDMIVDQPWIFTRLVGSLHPQPGHMADYADQRRLRDSLGLITDQTLPKPATVALYLFIYVLAMGPANYFLLSRYKRRDWAWASIPITILLFSSYGYFAGFRLRGGRPLVRQITIIQAESGAPLADVDAFAGIYSPFRSDYDLEIDRPVLVESMLDTFGVNNELTVTHSQTTIVENLQGDIGGIPGIVARSHTPAPRVTARLTFDNSTQRINGTITNETGRPITHAYLTSESRFLALGTLPVGDIVVDGLLESCAAYRCLFNRSDLKPDEAKAIDLASRGLAVQAILDSPDAASRPTHNRLYLAGWQEDSPITVTLSGTRSDRRSDTLLLVGLPF